MNELHCTICGEEVVDVNDKGGCENCGNKHLLTITQLYDIANIFFENNDIRQFLEEQEEMYE